MHHITENQAKNMLDKEIYAWINSKDFHWSDNLPYSCQQGWTTGWMSLIFDEDEGLSYKTVDELESNYHYCKLNSHWFG